MGALWVTYASGAATLAGLAMVVTGVRRIARRRRAGRMDALRRHYLERGYPGEDDIGTRIMNLKGRR